MTLQSPDGYMPIMGTGLAVRMSLLNEEWAQRNHGQSLVELRSRGGLAPCEAAAIADRRKWRAMGHATGLEFLLKLGGDGEKPKAHTDE